VATQVTKILDKERKTDGLAPIYISTTTGKFHGKMITLGARGDSYYEYLLKVWVQSERTDTRCARMYAEAQVNY
jgi:mannosyl-oligosaccharide alpha-1,2-mannosidase